MGAAVDAQTCIGFQWKKVEYLFLNPIVVRGALVLSPAPPEKCCCQAHGLLDQLQFRLDDMPTRKCKDDQISAKLQAHLTD